MENLYDLIEPFEYSNIWLLLSIIIMVFILIYLGYLLLGKKKSKKNIFSVDVSAQIDLNDLKNKYLVIIDNLEKELLSNRITLRKTYQKLSVLVRSFVFEATGIAVHRLTLSDIKDVNMPSLYDLIKEFYYPEFALYSEANLSLSIENTRKVIREWH